LVHLVCEPFLRATACSASRVLAIVEVDVDTTCQQHVQ